MPTRFIEHRGVPILLMDFHGIREKTLALREVREAKAFVARQPMRRQLRVLVDVADAQWDGEILEAVRDLVKHDEPYVFASAVVGVNPFARLTLRALLTLTGRKIGMLRDMQSAKDWLVGLERPADVVPDEA